MRTRRGDPSCLRSRCAGPAVAAIVERMLKLILPLLAAFAFVEFAPPAQAASSDSSMSSSICAKKKRRKRHGKKKAQEPAKSPASNI